MSHGSPHDARDGVAGEVESKSNEELRAILDEELSADAAAAIKALDQRKSQRIDDLEDEVAEKDAQIEAVQEEKDELRERVDEQADEIDALQEATDYLYGRLVDLEVDIKEREKSLRSQANAAITKAGKNQEVLGELVTRELRKDAHLSIETFDTLYQADKLDVPGGKVEEITKDDGNTYARLPGAEDAVDHGGGVALSHGDLLPIQQLARMDDEMLANATSTRDDYIAAKVWQKRGRHSPGSIWSSGGPGLKEYIDASDVRVFIKSKLEREDEDLSYQYAKKLAGDALQRIQELSKHRVQLIKKNHRKDGLQYKERRLQIDSDAEIPGETRASLPGTNEVTG